MDHNSNWRPAAPGGKSAIEMADQRSLSQLDLQRKRALEQQRMLGQEANLQNQQHNLISMHQRQLGNRSAADLGLQQQHQPNNVSILHHGPMPFLSGVSVPQQNMLNLPQPGSNLDSSRGNQPRSMQQVASGLIQPDTASAPQMSNFSPLSTHSAANGLQPNFPLQLNLRMNQYQHLKQQQETVLAQQKQLTQKQPMLERQERLHQQTKQQMHAEIQACHMPQLNQTNGVNYMMGRKGMVVNQGVFPQHLLSSQHSTYPHQKMTPGASYPSSSRQLLQSVSPHLLQHSSPKSDLQNLLSSPTETMSHRLSANTPFIAPSPSTPLALSPTPADSVTPISRISGAYPLANTKSIGHNRTTVAQVNTLTVRTPGTSATPLLKELTISGGTHCSTLPAVSGNAGVTEQPIERLIKAVKSMSPDVLIASISDIGSIVSMLDRFAFSAPGTGSIAAVGKDLVAMTKCRAQAKSFMIQHGMTGLKRKRHYISIMPLTDVSFKAGIISDSFKQSSSPEASDLEPTAKSSSKRLKIEANHALLEEIQEINQQLIDTVVDISDENVDPTAESREGTIVKCSFSAVAFCPLLKVQLSLAQMSPIRPLQLLVPTTYPTCSPVVLDKSPVKICKEYEELSLNAESKFNLSLRKLSSPLSLKDIAKTWDVCAHATISEFAEQSGGGAFSSKYGTWKSCQGAA